MTLLYRRLFRGCWGERPELADTSGGVEPLAVIHAIFKVGVA